MRLVGKDRVERGYEYELGMLEEEGQDETGRPGCPYVRLDILSSIYLEESPCILLH